MDTDWVLNHFGELQNAVQGSRGKQRQLQYKKRRQKDKCEICGEGGEEKFAPPRQINDHVYEVSNVYGRSSSVEVVFFHGLQLQQTDNPHIDTWRSKGGTESWLNWITEKFPDARIYTVKYDAHLRRTDANGRMDMYVTIENLLQCLIKAPPAGAHVGHYGNPVVLVGHCVGGLVMKQLCVYANSKVFPSSERFGKDVQKFLRNLKGFFFYASPHHGTRLADINTKSPKGPLFKGVTTHNAEAARRNEDFRVLRQNFDWKTYGVVESLEIALGKFKGLIVEEGSARYDVDGFYTARANHFDVCRPGSTISPEFSLLSTFIASTMEGEARCSPKISFADEVVGLHKQVIKVQKRLKKVRRLAIVGMGGIGKTTLAKTIYNTILGNYDYTCFLEEAKGYMKKEENPDELRTKITKKLFEKGKKVDDSFDWYTLKGKRVLIILDDVVSASQVSVMTEDDGFSHGSRLIVTSRDRGFLIREEFELFRAATLDKEDSKQLFCINAFKMADVPSEYKNRVVSLTKKCGGFPLALKIVGRFLYKRPVEIWDDALTRLSNAKALDGKTDDGLWSVLRVLYDGLQKEEREMFLDVASCFHGERLYEVKHMWSKCGKYDNLCWTNLVDRGFVTELGERVCDPIIQMHEVLRDLGRSIACPTENVTSHSRLQYQILGTIPTWPFKSEENPQAKILKISFMDWEHKQLQPVKFNEISVLHNLGELRVLWLDNLYLYGSCSFLPQKLVYVKIHNLHSWVDSPSEEISSQDYEPQQQLKYLEIVDSYQLRTLPASLGQLQDLEHLKLSNCSSLEALPDTLGQLEALEHLTIEWCLRLFLPDTLANLKKLKHLYILDCKSTGKLGDYVGQFESLEYLDLRIDTFPSSLWNLRHLQYLQLRCMSNSDLPNNFGELRALKELKFLRCENLKTLPDSLEQLEALEVLEIVHCGSFASLPTTIGQLQTLEVLEILECESFESLPTTIGQLKSLRKLELDYLVTSNAVPESFWDLRGLEDLTIPLEAIPDSLGKLQALKKLCLRNCGFKSLPATIVELKALDSLALDGCRNMEALPDEIGQLQCLRSLDILDCKLKTLPGSIRGLRALECLSLDLCDNFEALSASLGFLPVLKSLRIGRCDNLTTLPCTLGRLRSLEELRIWRCDSLTALPDTLGQLQSLETLEIEACKSLTTLPDTLGQLRSLQNLEVKACRSLTTLPDTLGALEGLEHLKVWLCDSLRELPESLERIRGKLKYVLLDSWHTQDSGSRWHTQDSGSSYSSMDRNYDPVCRCSAPE